MIVKLILQSFDMPDTNIVTAKQGDIVNIVPDDAIHADEGKVVRRTHLIIKVDLGNVLTNADHIHALRIEHFAGDTLWFPSLDPSKGEIGPAVLKKRRYRIPWDELMTKAQSLFGITVDTKQLLDENVDYQPLEKVIFPIADLVHDKVSAKKLAAADFLKIKKAIG